jgi:hypothetical protein
MNFPTEQRYDIRKSLQQNVSFELSTMGHGRVDNIVEQGVSVNLSQGGLGMITAYPLRSGEVVKLLFPVTEDAARVPVFTEVMWSEPAGAGYRVGLRFLM